MTDFGIPNGDMDGKDNDVMEDPVCCEDGDPFDDGTPSTVVGQEPITPEVHVESPPFHVDDEVDPDDLDHHDELGPPPVQEPLLYDDDDEPGVSGALKDIDDTVGVIGDEYPLLPDLGDDDEEFPVLEEGFDPSCGDGDEETFVDYNSSAPLSESGVLQLSDEEVWSGEVRLRGERDDVDGEPDLVKRRRLLDEDDGEWVEGLDLS